MSSLMSIGMRAMAASNAALQTTGHNIANASVEGYSRQEVQLETAQGQFSGSGFFGKGVDVVNVRRAHDQFLTMQATAAKSLSAMDDARANQLSQLEDIFPPGTQGLGNAMGEFYAAMVDLANAPSDPSSRQVVLARAADVADRYASSSNRLDILQAGVWSDLTTSAATVNGIAEQVATLNNQIAGYRGVAQLPNDLLDQRDKLISDIAAILPVNTITASDGSVGVFLTGGQRLVLGGEASKMVIQPDDADPSRAALAITTAGQTLPLGDSGLDGGSMAGLLKFQNDDLVDARNQLGQMATAFAAQINDAQAQGLDLSDPPGSGAPMFSLGETRALANVHNARDSNGDFLAGVDLTVTDASLLQASDYQMTATGTAGQYSLVRLSDGLSRTVSDGDEVDGFRIDVGTPDLQPGDSFRLQPVGHAASGMARALTDVKGIAAASPLTAVAGVGNTGTSTVTSLQMTGDTADRDITTSISFTSGTSYHWEMRDASGALTSSGDDVFTPGKPIAPGNGFELNIDGVPAAGDSFSVAGTQFPASNNGNALAMSAMADEKLVGRTLDANGSYLGGSTATDAYASTMADIGVRVQSAKSAAAISAASATQSNDLLSAKTGVNLDEEASKLIQFQQSYQAAAKVLQVAQSVFDTMLQLGS